MVNFHAISRQLPHPRRLLDLGPHDGAHRAALRAGAAVGIPLVVLWLFGRTDLALYTTFGAFTSFYGRSHSHFTRLRLQITVAVILVGAVATGSLVALSPARLWVVVPVAALYAGLATLASNALNWRPSGALFPVFALSATASIPGTVADALVATLLAAAAACFALLIGVAGRLLPAARATTSTVWGIDPIRASRHGGTWEDVIRTATAVFAAGLIPTALGLGYPYWSMVAAAAAVSGLNPTSRLIRAGHRLTGTLLGVGVAAAILVLSPAPLVTIIIICVLQVGAELFVVRNYGLALVFVTPLALIMIAFAHPTDTPTLLSHRIIETFIGVVTVISIALVEHIRHVPTPAVE